MKLQSSLRALYEAQKPLAEILADEVQAIVLGRKDRRWHYEQRIKSVESFCGKIETGRVDKPGALEDFLACTIVVPNALAIPTALEMVKEVFELSYQRPFDLAATGKSAETFRFDDLRLYCKRGNDGTRPPSPIDDFIFEIQIKTFLQHAWGIATHDLSYKTSEVSWGKDRIVAHLKAAIEHAELSILEADLLAQSRVLQLNHKYTTKVVKVIDIIKKNWKDIDKIYNVRGLAESVTNILRHAEISTTQLESALNRLRSDGGGDLPYNLSAYGVIVQSLLSSYEEKILEAVRDQKFKLVITPEISLRKDFPFEVLEDTCIVIPQV